MNRNLMTAVLLLSLGAGMAAAAPETNTSAGLDWSAFESIAQKNIFDPTRSGRSGGRKARAAVVRTFTFCGTINDEVAIFKGDGVPSDGGDLTLGKTINGFKVMKIPVSYADATVILTDPAGTIVTLKEGENMRREEDGPWVKSDQPAPVPVAASETPADESTASPVPASAGGNDVLARLRARHKQEE
ncbi:MAG: hypothetical protein ACLQU4_11925 [Limisphaerales bacterium]